MSDISGAIPLGLAQQRAAKNIDPEQLESMGKRAAALYVEAHCPLSHAVVEIVKEAQLAPEQVKRVCEFANTAAYLTEFEKGGELRNVTFDGGPADPSYVLKELNDGSSPAVHQIKTASYLPPQTNYKTTMASDAVLAEAFGVTRDFSKTASIDSDCRANQGEELADLRIRLEDMKGDLHSKYASSGVLLADIQQDLGDAVRQEIATGSSLGDVVTAWSSYSPDTSLLKQAMVFAADKLVTSGVMNKDEQRKSLVKTASMNRIPNPEHPVVDRFIAFTKVATEHRKLEHAVELVEDQLAQVNKQLRNLA